MDRLAHSIFFLCAVIAWLKGNGFCEEKKLKEETTALHFNPELISVLTLVRGSQ